MKIHTYTICYNEERMLPHFLDHYSKFSEKITIYDNMSTDNSRKIISEFKGCEIEVIPYDTNNKIDDSVYLKIKNNCWKNTNADYAFVVDCDE